MQFLENIWKKPYEVHTATIQNVGCNKMNTCL